MTRPKVRSSFPRTKIPRTENGFDPATSTKIFESLNVNFSTEDLNVEETPRNQQRLHPQHQQQLLQHLRQQQQLLLRRRQLHHKSLSMFQHTPGLLHHDQTIFQQASGLSLSEQQQQRQRPHLQQQQQLPQQQPPLPLPPPQQQQQRPDQQRCRCGWDTITILRTRTRTRSRRTRMKTWPRKTGKGSSRRQGTRERKCYNC